MCLDEAVHIGGNACGVLFKCFNWVNKTGNNDEQQENSFHNGGFVV
jgi:hypothetical protein